MKYVSIRISTLVPEKKIPFAVYIFFKEQYLLYIQPDHSIENDQVEKLKKQKITQFFIDVNDEDKYHLMLDEVIDDVINNRKKDITERSRIIRDTTNEATERIYENPECEKSYNQVTVAASNLRKMIDKNPESLRVLFTGKKTAETEFIVRHSFNVSTFSMEMAKMSGMSDHEQEKIGTASLLHDIGLLKLEPKYKKLISIPRERMPNDDRKKFMEHAGLGEELLKGKSYVDGHILNMIRYHEETICGNGPYEKMNLSESEKIISTVDYFDRNITIYKKTVKESIESMENNVHVLYDLKLLGNINEMIKMHKLDDDYKNGSFGRVFLKR